MPKLVPPTTAVHSSFLAAIAESAAGGRGGANDASVLSREAQTHGDTWVTPQGFAAYVDDVLGDVHEDHPRPEGWVPCTSLWWVEGEEYLGRVHIRHRLTPYLREVGGHVGYHVVPSHRRRGHATAMLSAALPVAAALGIECALITCDADNVGSRRVIEKNGGLLQDRRGVKFRFWVPTG